MYPRYPRKTCNGTSRANMSDGPIRKPAGGWARWVIGGLLIACLPGLAAGDPAAAPREAVVVLHGLGRTRASMWTLSCALRRQGYEVRSLGYPSRRYDAATLVRDYVRPGWERVRAEGWDRIHVVAHSLGGILLREVIGNEDVPELGRMVLLAPPGQGSEVADRLSGIGFYRWVLGPVMGDLRTGPSGLPARLPPVRWETGVIAGNRSFNPWFSSMIPGADDGKVGVDRAAVPGQTDFLVVPSSHTWMMNRRYVHQHVLNFLRHGTFQPPEPSYEDMPVPLASLLPDRRLS